jgi:hypothetical protein
VLRHTEKQRMEISLAEEQWAIPQG